MAQADTLRSQAEQAATLREENRRLADQLQAVSARSQAGLTELPRLRAQSARLRQVEQENAQLRAERNRLAQVTGSSAAAADEPADPEKAEAELRRTKGLFGRDLGMALIMAADANEGKLPTELSGPLFEVFEFLSPAANNGIRVKHFELVYNGSLRDVNTGETVLAREKEPIQSVSGKWMRLYVMADGSSRFVSADGRDGFAEREKEFWPAQFQR